MMVRRARAEDLDGVLALERGIAGAPHWAREEYAQMLAEEQGAGVRRVLLVAEQAALVGFAVGRAIGQGPEAVGEIESVAVVAGARRGGVGRALCEAVVRWCGEQGAAEVELEVRQGNAAAQTLYRRMGFREVGLRRGYYRDPVEDAVLMSLRGEALG